MENYNNLVTQIDSLRQDAEKFFDKQNKAAGTRLRKGLQEIKKLSNTLRKEVTELKKTDK